MPGIDELLRAEGERWRAEVDGHCPTTAAAPATSRRRPKIPTWQLPRRRILLWSASLSGAVAAVTLLVALIAHDGGGESGGASAARAASGAERSQNAAAGGAASAAAPGVASASRAPCRPLTLTVSPVSASPADVPPTPLPIAAGQPVVVTASYGPSCAQLGPAVERLVTLRLTTADGRTVVLLRARLRGVDGSFRVRATVPPTAAAGPATLTDQDGHRARLVITAR